MALAAADFNGYFQIKVPVQRSFQSVTAKDLKSPSSFGVGKHVLLPALF
jgi:hypothetical protein